MAGSVLRPAALVATALLVGCNLDPSEPEVRVCVPPELDTTQWQVIDGTYYSLRVPPSYEVDESSGRWYSGRTWIRPALILTGQTSPDPVEVLDNYNECRATVAGREMLLQLGTTSHGGQLGPGIYLAANWGRVNLPGEVPGAVVPATLIVEAWTPTEIPVEEILASFFTMVVTSSS